jgi:hypothetical protein
VVEELGQHIDGDTGVGVTLGVGVPVGIRHDLGFVELSAIVSSEDGELVDPGAVAQVEQTAADGLAPGGVGVRRGQQRQFRGWGVGEAFPDAALLGGDQRGGGWLIGNLRSRRARLWLS